VILYARRAVPWGLVFGGCVVVASLIAIVAIRPSGAWPLEGTAIGVLAAAAAWSMDETAAAVVDTLPRSLRWRTAARSLAGLPLAGAWVACVLIARDALPPHGGLFVLQGLAAVLAGIAFATRRRALGSACPGTRLASVTIALAGGIAVAPHALQKVPIFPIWTSDRWSLSLALWSGLAFVAAATLAISLCWTRRS
jgi:hypothetical protein